MIPLPVPFISQLINGNGGANCGPACMSMTLAYRGVVAPTQGTMLWLADIIRDGVPDGIGQTGGYTTFLQLTIAATWFGIDCIWLTSWPEIHRALAAGEPVTLLVDNRALWPRQYPRSAAFDADHFVLLTGYTPAEGSADEASDTFMVNDPLSVYAWGPARYTARSLADAANRLGGPLAIALAPVPVEPAPEEEDMGIIDELSKQVQLLREEVARRTEERDNLNGVNGTLGEQLKSVRATLAERDSTIGAYEVDVIPPLLNRVAQLEEEVKGKDSRRIVELVYSDGRRVSVPPE